MTHDVSLHVHNPDPPLLGYSSTVQARKAGWTEEGESKLETMLAAGFGYVEIGHALGRSKGSVARRRKALGISLPANFQTVQMMRGRGFTGQPKSKPEYIAEFNPADFTEHNIVGIAALQSHHCRFISNDDMTQPVYCGLSVLEGKSYCSGHCGIVYRPLEERRRA